MLRRLRRQAGLSLVEVTIMLLVLMLLTGVLAPSIMDFVPDAQWVKVKEDCEAIGVSVARFVRDQGPCFRFDGQNRLCSRSNIVPRLFSDGTAAAVNTTVAPDFTNNSNINGAGQWSMTGDTMANHLVYNTPQGDAARKYKTPGDPVVTFQSVGPQWNLGWRGGYLSPPIGPDPWGNQYLVNTLFLAPASDAGAPASEGGIGWDRDVFCLSPGPNRTVETFFGGELGNWNLPSPMGTFRGGDDLVYIIQGSTR